MSIKLRLILSNIAMIIVPIVLFIVASLLLSVLFLGDIREVTNLLPESHSQSSELQKDSSVFFEMKKKSVTNPKELLTNAYLVSVEKQLKEVNAGIILRKNEEILFASRDLQEINRDDLPEFGTTNMSRNLEPVGARTFAIKQHDYYDNDGGEISVLIMRDASPLNHFVKTFFPILFGICVLILVATNGLLTTYVSKSIIKPIDRLKNAAKSIKDGNLNHAIIAEKNDEIGQLTQSFEEMRVRLNESFEIQKQYEENRKELIAHISHDLKTPITTIKGYIEGIRDGIANTPEKYDRYIQTIYTKSVDLDRLIDELFLYSKLDLGKVPFVFEGFNLKNYLEDFIEELSFDLEEKDVKLTFEYDKNGDFNIYADREKLKRVFSNIIENSLKFMDKPKKVLLLTLHSKNGNLEIEISDNGLGIPEESLPFVFNRFYRADQSRNKLTGGSGLGLSIAKMIVDEHHGQIRVESKQTHGTKITIVLPHKYTGQSRG